MATSTKGPIRPVFAKGLRETRSGFFVTMRVRHPEPTRLSRIETGNDPLRRRGDMDGELSFIEIGVEDPQRGRAF